MTNNRKSNRKYYTLVIRRLDATLHWEIDFGDYDKQTVRYELEEHIDHGVSRKDLKIVCSGDTQEEINTAVADLNK